MSATTKKRTGAKGWFHPFKDITDPKIKLEEGEDVTMCFDFLREISCQPCQDRTTGHKFKRRCACLSILDGCVERQVAVAKYMAAFIQKPQQERHSIVMEWLRYTNTTKARDCFYIPFVGADDDEDDDDSSDEERPIQALKHWMVCKDAISLLLDYGHIKWKTCSLAVLQNRLPEHGNKGKLCGPARHFAVEVKQDLHAFFNEIKQFGSPKSTRFVREETGTGLRDDEENLLELPVCWSKRNVYGRFCYERGVIITTTAGGNEIKTEKSDKEWDPTNKKRICSWPTFLTFWAENYPLIRIGTASADICTDCHIFFNRSKYTTSSGGEESSQNTILENNSNREDQSINYCRSVGTYFRTEHDNDEVHQNEAPVNDEMPVDDEMPVNDLQLIENVQVDMMEREAILLKATLHVKQAIIQRKLANAKIQEAIDTANLPHSERAYCFIADFSQNMELPFFGESQPGDTYYFSALKINVFGIVDASIFGGKLSAHVYHEGVGKKKVETTSQHC